MRATHAVRCTCMAAIMSLSISRPETRAFFSMPRAAKKLPERPPIKLHMGAPRDADDILTHQDRHFKHTCKDGEFDKGCVERFAATAAETAGFRQESPGNRAFDDVNTDTRIGLTLRSAGAPQLDANQEKPPPTGRVTSGSAGPLFSRLKRSRPTMPAAGGVRGGAGSSSPPKFVNAMEGVKNGFASGLAAACVKTVLQPFDTLKTVQQFSTARMTLLQAGRVLVARGGFQELYQGLGVTLVGSMPSVGVYFGLYQFLKNKMDAQEGISPYVSVVVSAGVGNFVASCFRVPYEVVKQRLQVGAYPNTMVALCAIYKEGGLLGFFGKGGLKTQWARDIPYAMVTLLVYETLQKAAARRRGPGGPKKGSALENMVIGAIAGGMGSLVTNPMDMIKTRMMVSPELYAGPMDAAWTALRMEGPQAFMKGATPRLLHKIPANAFFFVAYEFFRSILGVAR